MDARRRLASVISQYQRDKIDLRVIAVTGLDTGFSPLASLQVHMSKLARSASDHLPLVAKLEF